MVTTPTRYLTILVLICFLLSGVVAAVLLNTDFGNVDVKNISIPNYAGHANALLYRPQYATSINPLPAVVLVHGISNAKQAMSSIALELARNGFVALAIDIVGHGSSDGQLRSSISDPTLGTLAAVHYLESQVFVNASLIGLIGHSLGAGAIRATAVSHGNILASVFIGGGLDNITRDPAYGLLNSTFPKNLLVAVGKYDVLYNLAQLKTQLLLPVFDTSHEVVPNDLYGNFSYQTARKLITPATAHIFEPLDPMIVSEIVSWMTNSLKPEQVRQNESSEISMVYFYREGAILISMISSICLIFPVSRIIWQSLPHKTKKLSIATKEVVEDWKVLIIWGGLALVLYLPMSFVGFLISFPPLIFGASIAWWMLATAATGLLVLLLWSRFSKLHLGFKETMSETFEWQATVTAISVFLVLYLIASSLEVFLAINLQIVVPLFRSFTPPFRVLMFATFIPFFFFYFFVERFYFSRFLNQQFRQNGFKPKFFAVNKAIWVKISPYLAVLCVQYVPMVLLNIRFFSTYVAFLIEFFWMLVPIFIISTACSYWFCQNNSDGAAVIFNAFLFSWVAATVFPF